MTKLSYAFYTVVFANVFLFWVALTILLVATMFPCPVGVGILPIGIYVTLGMLSVTLIHNSPNILHPENALFGWPLLTLLWVRKIRKIFGVPPTKYSDFDHTPKPVGRSPLCYVCGSREDVVEAICCQRSVCPRHRFGTGAIADGYSCTRHPFHPFKV